MRHTRRLFLVEHRNLVTFLQFETKTSRRTQDEFDTPSTPPSAICPTPATQNDGRCEFVPRLPRRTNVNVTKCHACHAECRGVTRDQGAPKPVQARHPVPSVLRLPRKTTVDVSLCHATQCHLSHACHAKRR